MFAALAEINRFILKGMDEGVEHPSLEGEVTVPTTQIFFDIAKEFEFTHGEMLRALCDAQSSLVKNLIRAERHPDHPDTPGGLAHVD